MNRSNTIMTSQFRTCLWAVTLWIFLLAQPQVACADDGVPVQLSQPSDGKSDDIKPKTDGPVELKGDKVEFNNVEKTFDAQGSVVLSRGDTKIYADQMQFYREDSIGIAEGNIVVETPKGTIFGDKMTYSMDKQTGNFTNARIFADPYYGKGNVISKVGPNKMNMQDGYLTTCDHDKPHFRLQASSIDVEPGKQAQARRVKMFVGPVPIMYLPRYTQSLVDRHPRYSLTPGYSKDFGFYALQAWRYDFNEKVKGTFHADFRDRKGAGVGGDLNYATDHYGEGYVSTYYTNEYNIGDAHLWESPRPKATYRERYKREWHHKWDIDDKTTATWQYYKLSDTDFLKEYFERQYRNSPSPSTYFVLTRALGLGTLGFNLQKRVNKFNTEIERLPEISYNLDTQEIAQTGFYFKNTTLYSNLAKKFAAPEEANLSTERLDTQNEISYPTKLGFVEFRPFVGTQHTYYSRTVDPEDYNSLRGQFKTGADLSTKFYKVLDVEGKFLGMDVHRLRHIVTPSIAYRYAHDPTIVNTKFDQFDSIDSLTRAHSIGLGLENKLQTKRDGKPVDLGRLVLEAPFALKENPGKGGFNDVNTKLELNPTDWLAFSNDNTYDTQAEHLKTANFDMYITDKKREWSFNIGKRYSFDVDDQITTELAYKINPLWKFKIYERFDIDGGIQKEQQYTLTRDLHEWEMDVNYRQVRGDGNEIWLIFRLKAFPDLAVDAGTSFNKRKTGSQSGL